MVLYCIYKLKQRANNMATLIKRYGMFTTNGNKMVGRIVDAAQHLIALDGDKLNAWQFAYRELQKLSFAEGFEEATAKNTKNITSGNIARSGASVTGN